MSSKVTIQENLHADLRDLFVAGIEALKPAALLRKTLHYEPKSSSPIVDGKSYNLNKLAENKTQQSETFTLVAILSILQQCTHSRLWKSCAGNGF